MLRVKYTTAAEPGKVEVLENDNMTIMDYLKGKNANMMATFSLNGILLSVVDLNNTFAAYVDSGIIKNEEATIWEIPKTTGN